VIASIARLRLDLRGAFSLPGEADIVVFEQKGRFIERLTIVQYGERLEDEHSYDFVVRDGKGEISRRSAQDLGLIEDGDRVAFFALAGDHELESSVA